MASVASGGTAARITARIFFKVLRAGSGTPARYSSTFFGATLPFAAAFFIRAIAQDYHATVRREKREVCSLIPQGTPSRRARRGQRGHRCLVDGVCTRRKHMPPPGRRTRARKNRAGRPWRPFRAGEEQGPEPGGSSHCCAVPLTTNANGISSPEDSLIPAEKM